jgi:hypothetical protein
MYPKADIPVFEMSLEHISIRHITATRMVVT